MEQKYVYRVLNKQEMEYNEILSKEYFDYMPFDACKFQNRLGKDALDRVAAHITKGNNTHTSWISCSKSLDILYNFATSQTDIRPSFALIKNHSKTIFKSQKFEELHDLLRKEQILQKIIIKINEKRLFDLNSENIKTLYEHKLLR